MRHGNSGRKLNRTASHRKAMFANMKSNFADGTITQGRMLPNGDMEGEITIKTSTKNAAKTAETAGNINAAGARTSSRTGSGGG